MAEPSPRKYRREQSEETTRRCQFCGEVFVSRGMGTHVRNSSGNGHGEHGNTPDCYDIDKCEEDGTTSVTVKERVTTDVDSGKELYVCKFCEKFCKGYRAFKIHLSRSEDDNDHPNNSESVGDDSYAIIPADDDWNPVSQQAMMQAIDTLYDEEKEMVQVPSMELYKIRSHLNDPDIGKEEAAREMTRLINQFV